MFEAVRSLHGHSAVVIHIYHVVYVLGDVLVEVAVLALPHVLLLLTL